MKRARILVFAALLAFGWNAPLSAKDFTRDSQKYAFEIPDDWAIRQNPPAIVEAFNPDNTKSFLVMVQMLPDFYAVTDADEEQFEHNLRTQGWTVTQREKATLGDVPVYSIFASKVDPRGGTLYMRSQFGFANHNGYIYGVTKLHEDPSTDSECMAVLKSFHFLGTPEAPTEARPVPIQFENRPLSYKIGYYAEKFVHWPYVLAPIIGAVLVIGLIAFLVMRKRQAEERRRRAAEAEDDE